MHISGAAPTPLPTGSLDSQGVPHVHVEVVVARHQEAARLGEGHRGHATDDVVVRVLCELLVSPDVVQLHRGVVRARAEGRALRKELQWGGEEVNEVSEVKKESKEERKEEKKDIRHMERKFALRPARSASSESQTLQLKSS